MSAEKLPAEYTDWELGRCLRMAGTLSGELGHCVPVRMRVMLDTWRADMLAEAEERAERAGTAGR